MVKMFGKPIENISNAHESVRLVVFFCKRYYCYSLSENRKNKYTDIHLHSECILGDHELVINTTSKYLILSDPFIRFIIIIQNCSQLLTNAIKPIHMLTFRAIDVQDTILFTLNVIVG